MNLNAGGVRDWEMEGIHWQFHPDADIAVAPFTWGSELKVASVDLAYGLTEAKRLEKRVECGDIAYIVGLFRLHHGSKKNIPIVHTGHIAALPDDEELVAVYDKVTGKTARVKAYLIEAQTLDGLSGSPVFVRRGGKALGIQQDSAIHPLGYGAVFLLGVYIASWEAEACEILERDFDIDSNKVRVPVGMGSVATFDQIMDVVNGKELTALRSRQGIAPDQS